MTSTEEQFASSVELEVDDGTDTLGDKAPRTITDQQRRVLLQQAGSRRVSADVVSLAHGTFHNQSATLMALRFQFSYQPQSSNRLSSAELNIAFRPGPNGSDFPTIYRFAPTNIRADVTTASLLKATQVGLSTGINTLPAPIGAQVSAERASQVSYTQEFRCDVIGEPWTSDEAYNADCEVDNAVTWHLNEHKLLKEGIPRGLRAVLVVGRSQPSVQAKVTAKVKTNWGLSLSGSLFSQARPLLIEDSVAFGTQPLSDKFDLLTTEQLDAFVWLDRPFVSLAPGGGRADS